MSERYLKPAEVAEIIRVSPSTLRWWRHVGRGPTYIKPSAGNVLYAESDVQAFLVAGRRDPSEAA